MGDPGSLQAGTALVCGAAFLCWKSSLRWTGVAPEGELTPQGLVAGPSWYVYTAAFFQKMAVFPEKLSLRPHYYSVLSTESLKNGGDFLTAVNLFL